MARLLIAGCGDLGLGLGSNLLTLKHEVIGLRRTPGSDSDPFPMLSADLTRPGPWRADIPNADWVIYAAAPDKRDEGAYRATYLDGVRNLFEAFRLKNTLPKRFIFASSTAVYGQHQGEWVDETATTEPQSFNGRVLLEAEKQVRSFFPEAVIVRFSGIYGPNRRRLLDAMVEGTWPKQPDSPYFANRIHRDDCIGLLQHLLLSDSPPSLILGSDDEPADVREIREWIAEVIGEESGEQGLGKFSYGEIDPFIDIGKRCSNSLLRSLGYALRYPTYREGYKPLLQP